MSTSFLDQLLKSADDITLYQSISGTENFPNLSNNFSLSHDFLFVLLRILICQITLNIYLIFIGLLTRLTLLSLT